MRVFMLGWEFPPYISGGLGTACYGLTKGLNEADVDVCFVLPTAVPLDAAKEQQDFVQLRSPTDLVSKQILIEQEDEKHPHHVKSPVDYQDIFSHLEVHQLPAVLSPYCTPERFEQNTTVLRQHARQQAQKDALRRALKATMREVAELSKADKPAAQSPQAEKNDNGSIIHGTAGVHYEGDLYTQVHNFATLALELSTHEEFDIIHAHDWMTFPAGMAVAKSTGKPLVVHVHSTEFDRSGEHVNQLIYDFERAGMEAADRVVCVSHLTANIVEHRYGISRDKITVLYNAVELPDHEETFKPIARNEKIVLFLGRVTMQKGPEYFLEAAKRVVEKYKKVRFVMAGSGDMIRHCINLAAELNIGKYVTFTGFLRGKDVDRIFRMADLYVMPSVSEPFGIAPLEAISRDVPVLISKQSGVSEILTHVLKVDFWDTDEMANKILAVLRHKPLQSTLKEHGKIELKHISWADSALQLKQLYATLMENQQEA